MNFESFKKSEKLPEEIIIPVEELQTNSDGKKYRYEKNGVYYGGDYLNELPEEINIDLPPPPPENNPVI